MSISIYSISMLLISYLHSDKQRLSGSEARWGVFLHQGQSAETKLVDRFIRVQWREVSVYLAIILSNVEAVGVHILTVEGCAGEEEVCYTEIDNLWNWCWNGFVLTWVWVLVPRLCTANRWARWDHERGRWRWSPLSLDVLSPEPSALRGRRLSFLSPLCQCGPKRCGPAVRLNRVKGKKSI